VADALVVAIADSFPALQRWMAWAQAMPTPEELRAVLVAGESAFDADHEWNYTVHDLATDALVGGAGIGWRGGPEVLEIGYWIGSDRTGRGYATAAAKALTDVAFTRVPDLERIEIHMDGANGASAAIPPKVGYRLDREEVRPIEATGHTGVGLVWVLDRPVPLRR
jgi:RimJ/RimL family protein N-acetyltransferase